MTSPSRKPKKKLPLPIKKVRKEIPPPVQAFKERKKYDRKRAKRELKRALKNSSFRANLSAASKEKLSS